MCENAATNYAKQRDRGSGQLEENNVSIVSYEITHQRSRDKYEKFSDAELGRVRFAIENLTPRRVH